MASNNNNTQIKELLKDELLIKRCNDFTHKALSNGMNIDRVCMLVKDYQTKYIYIKEQDENLIEDFTFEFWYKNILSKQN